MAQKEDNSKVVAILSYFLVGIIWYFADKGAQNKTTAFHVKQALNLLVISFGVMIVFSILATILTIVSFGFLAIILAPVGLLINLAFLILWVIGLIRAVTLENREIPFIGKFAQKYLSF